MGDVFSISEFIWAIINFLILLIVLRVVFYKPVLGMLDRRNEEIRSNLDEAAKAREEADRLHREYEERLKGARNEAQQIVDRAHRFAEEAREKINAQANEEAEHTLERAEERIRRERDRALEDLRREAAELALMAAAKVLGRAVDDEDNQRLAREFVEQVGEGH